jgi:hypothetical protein
MHSTQQVYRTALITGATSGIGAAFANELAPTTNLLLTGRSEQRLHQLRSDLEADGGRVACLAADLATTDGRAALIERAIDEQIDLLVCNAGLGFSGNFLDLRTADAREILTVNVVAVMELLHALLPSMIERARRYNRRAGAIIVSSTAAFAQVPASVACYGASKAFVLRLAEALAKELHADPVDVLALCPAETATDFFARAGLPTPRRAMAAETVAREGLRSLGRRTVHVCGIDRSSQAVRKLEAYNPAVAEVLRLPRRMLARLLPVHLRRLLRSLRSCTSV